MSVHHGAHGNALAQCPGKAGPSNRHGSLVVLGGVGVLIVGNSGCGKTTLAFGLIERCARLGTTAMFVADDQVFVDRKHGVLTGSVPDSLAGKAELHGFGIIAVPHLAEHRIDLIARLGPANRLQRMPDPATIKLHDQELPVIELPERHESQSARLLSAWLDANRPNWQFRHGSP